MPNFRRRWQVWHGSGGSSGLLATEDFRLLLGGIFDQLDPDEALRLTVSGRRNPDDELLVTSSRRRVQVTSPDDG